MSMSMSQIIGLTPVEIHTDEDNIYMKFSSGESCRWWHAQDCCETVVIEDITGDFADLIGHPILVAEERINSADYADLDGSQTWTFYTFRSVGGSVDVRWHGISNGYYSESVDFTFTPSNTVN